MRASRVYSAEPRISINVFTSFGHYVISLILQNNAKQSGVTWAINWFYLRVVTNPLLWITYVRRNLDDYHLFHFVFAFRGFNTCPHGQQRLVNTCPHAQQRLVNTCPHTQQRLVNTCPHAQKMLVNTCPHAQQRLVNTCPHAQQRLVETCLHTQQRLIHGKRRVYFMQCRI